MSPSRIMFSSCSLCSVSFSCSARNLWVNCHIWSPWIAINYLNKFFWPEFSMSLAVQLAEAECLLVYQNNRPASYN